MSDLNNLGHKVSFRTILFDALVRQEWGTEWHQPQVCYEMSNGREFLDTDREDTGVYGIILYDDILTEVDPQNPNTYDSPGWLLTESGLEIGRDE